MCLYLCVCACAQPSTHSFASLRHVLTIIYPLCHSHILEIQDPEIQAKSGYKKSPMVCLPSHTGAAVLIADWSNTESFVLAVSPYCSRLLLADKPRDGVRPFQSLQIKVASSLGRGYGGQQLPPCLQDLQTCYHLIASKHLCLHISLLLTKKGLLLFSGQFMFSIPAGWPSPDNQRLVTFPFRHCNVCTPGVPQTVFALSRGPPTIMLKWATKHLQQGLDRPTQGTMSCQCALTAASC